MKRFLNETLKFLATIPAVTLAAPLRPTDFIATANELAPPRSTPGRVVYARVLDASTIDDPLVWTCTNPTPFWPRVMRVDPKQPPMMVMESEFLKMLTRKTP